MENLQKILQESKENKWPYPKTFEALIKAGVRSYTVRFNQRYEATYSGSFGTYQESSLESYRPLTPSLTFSKAGMRQAVVTHIEKRTSFLDFLKDAASAGATHYTVDMQKRTISYYNADESSCYQEIVPQYTQ